MVVNVEVKSAHVFAQKTTAQQTVFVLQVSDSHCSVYLRDCSRGINPTHIKVHMQSFVF